MKCDCANCPTHACYTKGVNCTGVPLEAVKEAYNEEELKLMQEAGEEYQIRFRCVELWEQLRQWLHK